MTQNTLSIPQPIGSKPDPFVISARFTRPHAPKRQFAANSSLFMASVLQPCLAEHLGKIRNSLAVLIDDAYGPQTEANAFASHTNECARSLVLQLHCLAPPISAWKLMFLEEEKYFPATNRFSLSEISDLARNHAKDQVLDPQTLIPLMITVASFCHIVNNRAGPIVASGQQVVRFPIPLAPAAKDAQEQFATALEAFRQDLTSLHSLSLNLQCYTKKVIVNLADNVLSAPELSAFLTQQLEL